jgi:acyl-CoA hydrolase
MNLHKRLADAKTSLFKAVFPDTTNHYHTMFGGTVLSLMDEAAFIAATRFTRMRVVTVSSDRVDFKQPIPAGTFVELVASISEVRTSSLKVKVEVFVEQMYSYKRDRAVTGVFTFVALDEQHRPTKIHTESESV